MLQVVVELFLRVVFEVALHWTGKVVLMLFGVRCSFGDSWGLRRKGRGDIKPPWTWTRGERRYLRSDIVQLIGLLIFALVIGGIVLLVWYLPAGPES